METPRENPTVHFLHTPRRGPPEDLIRGYAHYLLSLINCDRLPVSLNAIRKRLGLTVYRKPLPGLRGCTNPALTIYVNSDDRLAVQKFSAAHELFEVLFFAIRDDVAADWMDDNLFTGLMERKEALCEIGAAELTMPLPLFSDLIGQHPVCLDAAKEAATLCGVSLTATIYRIIDLGLAAKALVICQHKHKPLDRFPSRVGQGNLFGTPEFMDAERKMRIIRSFVPPDFVGYIPHEKSVPCTSLIQCAFDEGVIVSGTDYFNVGDLRGRYYVEATPFRIDDERHVMALVHLDRPDTCRPRTLGDWAAYKLPMRAS